MTSSPKIVFVVMSAVNRPATVDQLARALSPYPVLVHHDFSQTPAFELNAPNVEFVPNPKRTGWAVWGFAEGIFHSLRHAVQHLDFDYVQLLSPTCLPIKPMAQFETHVATGASEANFGWVDLLGERDVLMSVGYRAFSPENSFRHRVLRRLSWMYYSPSSGRVDVAGVQLRTGVATNSRGQMSVIARIALWTMMASIHPLIGRHIFDKNLRPYYGSSWFGARRHVIENILEHYQRPEIQRYFPKLRIADEFLIPTLLKHCCAKPGPSNHFINTFNEANPRWFGDSDFSRLQQSPAFFARKFEDDPMLPIRYRVLTELVGATEFAALTAA